MLLNPGLHFLLWPLLNVVGTLSLRIQQLDVYCETKTKDNVFVQVAVAVQFRVLAESAYEAYYRLTGKNSLVPYVAIVVVPYQYCAVVGPQQRVDCSPRLPFFILHIHQIHAPRFRVTSLT